MSLQAGDILGDHRVLEPIGSGGMGAVYKAEHRITRRIEAMKVLPFGIGAGPEEAERFEREIQVQARLQHPRIATLYTAVRNQNAIALLMEYVEGESLQRLLERQRLPVHVALGYAWQVLDALEYAHRHGVIHCDVSPANILVAPDGTVKLTDFGLARAAADLHGASGVPMGSPWYMPPEQVRGVEEIDARADVYAAGAVLYEMLTARKLYDADGTFAILQAQLQTMPLPPSAHSPGLPAALDAAVMKALAKDRAARFESAGAFRAELEAAAPKRKRRGRLTVVAAPLIFSAAVAGVFGAALLRTNRAQTPPPEVVPAVVSAPAPAPGPAAIPEEPERIEPPPVSAPTPVAPRRISQRAAANVEAAPPAALHGPRVEAHPPAATAPAQEHEPPAIAPPLAPTVETPYDTAATVPAEAPPPPPPAEEVKAEKSGNRFVRALGKLNPFRRSAKKEKPEEKQR